MSAELPIHAALPALRDALRRGSTAVLEAPPGAALHIRFTAGQSVEETIRAMEVVKSELRARPGGTKVVVYIPQAGGAQQLPMEIRTGVAWDPSFPAAIRGRVGAAAIRFDLLTEGESLPAA